MRPWRASPGPCAWSATRPSSVATWRSPARRRWPPCAGSGARPGRKSWARGARGRLGRLHGFLASGRLQVRVLPNDAFGLVHGKAGVITLADGRRTSFLGSVNETASGWRLNYELLWEDDSPEAVAWVQEEFDALWGSPYAVPLAEFVIGDIGRLARREVIADIAAWRAAPDPAAPVVESPVYRQEVGLWEHQKHFVRLAFDAHRTPHGARFVLADQVGLGKTLQLAMAAQLMALTGDLPVLVLVPKPPVWQWRDELAKLLPGEPVGLYAGRSRSGLITNGVFATTARETLKAAATCASWSAPTQRPRA